ncbi:hypothetical protein QBC39DRAFT_330439 [Podospora conica]|nr:hypothetical protein QBC39DRAFT_330439 [Schizothecium conicum]
MDEPPPYRTPSSTASSRSGPGSSLSEASISRSRNGRENLRASAEAMLRASLARRPAPSTISDQSSSTGELTPASSTANTTAVRGTAPPNGAREADSTARRISFTEDPAMSAAMSSAAGRARLAASLRLPAPGYDMTTTRTRERLRQAEVERDEALLAHENERRIAERLKREGEAGPSETEAELRILRFKYEAMRASAQLTSEQPPHYSDTPPPGLFRTACSTDLMFLIDTTSSMSPSIKAAKNQVRSIVDDIKVTFLNEADVRVGIVSYKDHDDDPNIEFLDFTPDVDKVHAFLSDLEAVGGGDTPEDVLGGLQQAVNASWKHQTRCIIHIADAPPHGTALHDFGSDDDDYPEPGSEPHGLTHGPLLQKMISLKINYALLRITPATDKMAYVFLKAYTQAAPGGKLDPSNKYYRKAETLTATRGPGTSRASGGGLSFEEIKLGTTFSALRHLVVKQVTMSAARTAVRMSTSRGPRGTTARTSVPMISEDDEPPEVELETDAPRWNDTNWLDEIVAVKAYSTDVATQHGAGTLDSMMAHDDNIKISTTELTIHKRSKPFAQGAIRLASYAQTPVSTNHLVVKTYKRDGKRLADLAEDMRCQALCKAFALEFNSMLDERHSVDFVVVTCLEPKSSADFNGECMSLEPLLQGDYVKYNSNCGYVNNEQPDDPFHHAAQAFSHFSFERSRGAFLVADLQGVNHVLTDPAIHARDPNRFRLSDGNLGEDGFKFFFATHECNPVCRALGLKSCAAMLMEGRFEFRTLWPATNPSSGGMACCSNKLCSRIVTPAKAQTSPEFEGYYWCDTCWPQLRSSMTRFICIAADGPHHEFDLSRFFYESQGRILPRRCPEHRAATDFTSRTAAVGLHVASRRSGGLEPVARHVTGGVSIFGPRTATRGAVSP